MKPKRLSAVAAAGLMALMSTEASAQIVVDGTCTLRDAIAAANSDAMVGTCAAGSGVDTIVITVPVTLSMIDNVLDGPNGLPSVVTDIIIEGNNLTIERAQGVEPFRVLHVDTVGNLTLENVTVSGGESPHGGGIFNLGTLNLINTTVSSNLAVTSSTIGYTYARGGGLFNNGTAILTNSTIVSNLVTTTLNYVATGGGIHNDAGALTLVNSTVSDNRASSDDLAYGGGIANWAGGTLELRETTISNNVASSTISFVGGGGIENQGILTLTNSTISGNHASAPGQSGVGGGIDSYGYDITYTASLENSTVSSNMVTGALDALGGGVYATTDIQITNSTISFNAVSSTTAYYASGGNFFNPGYGDVTNSLFVNGTPTNCMGTVTNLGGNFADDPSCLGVSTANILLEPTLADNGGPTETHALLENSVAIDAAGICGIAQDQRGAGRVMECDSGAFEFIPCGTLVLSNRIILGSESWEACLDAQLGGLLSVEEGGHLTIAAGKSVTIVGPATFDGLTIVIDPSLQISSPEALRLQGRDPATGSSSRE